MARRLLPGFLVFAALLSDLSGNHGAALVLTLVLYVAISVGALMPRHAEVRITAP